MILGFSLLNPHVYLDTVILLGSMGARHGTGRADFAVGAIAASVVWFFSLSYGAGMLAPIFKKKIVWQFLDFAIGVIMAVIAVNLGFYLYKI
jgi:L-lysine exporter family protein LysE/ArgO